MTNSSSFIDKNISNTFGTPESYYEALDGLALSEERSVTVDRSYGAFANATICQLSERLSTCESAVGTLLFPSGLSAITLTLLALCAPGDEIIVSEGIYHRVMRFIQHTLGQLGITYQVLSPNASLKSLMTKCTRVLYIENPSSIRYTIFDMPSLLKEAQQQHITTISDNSWGTFYFHTPLTLGCDIAICSATKYIAGSGDTLLGYTSFATEEIFQKVYMFYSNMGISVSPEACYTCLQGLDTLEVRLHQHYRHALSVATQLENHPDIDSVWYPALESHPSHERWKMLYSGANGLVTFSLNYPVTQEKYVEALQVAPLFVTGAGWGSCQSKILPILYQEHHSQKNLSLFRIHCGLKPLPLLSEQLEAMLSVLCSK